jgi:hypothetical protein
MPYSASKQMDVCFSSTAKANEARLLQHAPQRIKGADDIRALNCI